MLLISIERVGYPCNCRCRRAGMEVRRTKHPMKIFNNILTGLVAFMFAIFTFTWVYDALTITQGDDVSMFYVKSSGYLTQAYPSIIGWLVPLIIIIAILVFLRFHLARLALGIGLLIMAIMTRASLFDGIWNNPFVRHNIYPYGADKLLTSFLGLTFPIVIIYIIYQVYMVKLNGLKHAK